MQNTSFFSFSMIVLAATGALIGALLSYPLAGFIGSLFVPAESPYGYAPQGWCNVLAVKLHGAIVSTRSEIPTSDLIQEVRPDGTTALIAPNYVVASDVRDVLERVKHDPAIAAVVIDVDSPGGGPTASFEVGDAILNLGKPSVALIHEMGTSGGYWVAASAERVFAYPTSMIGSIGVTSSYLSSAEKNKKEGFTFNQLSSGKFKDMLSPDKPLTDEERTIAMKELEELHTIFVNEVASMRGLPVEHVARIADGSSMNGGTALENGLIDEMGGLDSVVGYLENKLGTPVALCWK